MPHESKIYAGVANLIAHGVWKEDDSLNDETIGRASLLMDRAWKLCSTEEETPEDIYRDWLNSAINHVGGWIGEFWVRHCSYLRNREGGNWRRLPHTLREQIEDAIGGTNRVRVYARIVLMPWLGFFHSWDRQFAEGKLLPLFNWQRDPVVAQQSWSVFLNYNHESSHELEVQLMPFYRQFADAGVAERPQQLDEHARRGLGQRLAVLAMEVISDPVESGFFREFLPILPEEVRESIAKGMDHCLQQFDDSARRRVWETWLKRYLELRLLGVPVALSTAETKHMLDWCLHLGPVFAEAVDVIRKMPQKNVFAYGIIQQLSVSPELDKFPLDACRFAIVVLQAEDYPHLHKECLVLHQTFKTAIPKAPELKTYEELLYLRGWDKK